MGAANEARDLHQRWLEPFCLAENATFIDPTRELLEAELAGKQTFDHFTPYEHIATANAKTWLETPRTIMWVCNPCPPRRAS